MNKILPFLLVMFFSPSATFSQNWVQVGNGGLGFYNGITRLFADTAHNKLLAAGNLKADNGMDTIFRVAQWNGVNWDSLGLGIDNNSVNAIGLFDGNIVVAGNFTLAGGLPVHHIAEWNGVSWDSLQSGIDNSVYDLMEFENSLYVVGFFYNAGGVESNSFAKWNGVTWDSVGLTPASYARLRAIIEYNNEVYVGGSIENIIIESPNILKWNEVSWSAVGQGVPDGYLDDPVKCFQVYQDKLFIGGDFWNDWRFPGIVYWDGANYTCPGGGVDGIIFDMAVFNDTLYVVGEFSIAGGIPANCIAKWDGYNWCSLGSTFNAPIRSIEVFNNELFIGGHFSQIDGQPINNIARWIGGNYVDQCGNTTSTELIKSIDLQVYPNPLSNYLNIEIPDDLNIQSITCLNSMGQKVFEQMITNSNEQLFLGHLPNGFYTIVIETNDGIMTRKIVKQ